MGAHELGATLSDVQAHAAPAEALGPALPKRDVVVEDGPGRADISALRELWAYRTVLTAFVRRQVKVKYKQAALGIGWAIVQPVAGALLFALFLGHFAHVGSEGVPYLLFALVGTVTWTFFSAVVSRSMESLISEQSVLRKVFFPRELLPLSGAVAAFVDFLPAAATLIVAALVYGIHPTPAWVAAPLLVATLFIAALGIGVALAALNVYYRDVRYVLPFLLQLGLFVSPVVFSAHVVPPRWRGPYEVLNPAASTIEGLRRALLHGAWPSGSITALSLLWALAILTAGYLLFKRLERGFADRV